MFQNRSTYLEPVHYQHVLLLRPAVAPKSLARAEDDHGHDFLCHVSPFRNQNLSLLRSWHC
jgi:hypothetical protein